MGKPCAFHPAKCRAPVDGSIIPKGYAMKTSSVILLALFIVSACGDRESHERFKQDVDDMGLVDTAKEDVRKILRDPDSAIFPSASVSRKMGKPVVCGQVNARNGFGGMTGPKRFVAIPTALAVTEDNMDQSEFQKVWNSAC